MENINIYRVQCGELMADVLLTFRRVDNEYNMDDGGGGNTPCCHSLKRVDFSD